MREPSISVKRQDVGPAKRVTVGIAPTSFSLTGLNELIAQLTSARDELAEATEAHYTGMLAEAIEKNR